MELLSTFVLRYIQAISKRDRIDVPPENQTDFIALFGLLQRTRRLAQAYLRLRKAGYSSEGKVLLRAALEHSVTAQWAYLTPGGIARLNISQVRAQRDYLQVIASTSSKTELQEWADSIETPEGKGLPKFTGTDGIMNELDSVMFLKSSYKVLSQVGHVTHEAALDFIVEVEGELQLRDSPEASMEHELLYALAGFCMLSAWIMARLQGDDDEIRRLQEISTGLQVPWRLDVHLEPARRRFPDEDV
ncbi:DUF5677 domain-containing protein [Agromyces sp. NPDC056965]|uniref:DUF5677 domain-containing protein n=1 Tax=Agromyces sp. NPDC056965 TaxID=3345983 RepID=UPI00362ECBCC